MLYKLSFLWFHLWWHEMEDMLREMMSLAQSLLFHILFHQHSISFINLRSYTRINIKKYVVEGEPKINWWKCVHKRNRSEWNTHQRDAETFLWYLLSLEEQRSKTRRHQTKWYDTGNIIKHRNSSFSTKIIFTTVNSCIGIGNLLILN